MEEEEAMGPQLTAKLESCGISAADVKKLEEAGEKAVKRGSGSRSCRLRTQTTKCK